MRNRRKTNVKNIKDYMVPIITLGLILILLYVAFSWGDSKSDESWTNTNINSQSPNEISIALDDNDAKVILIDENDKKTTLNSGDWINPGQKVMVEKWSMSFSIPGEARFSLNKNWELEYQRNSKMNLISSALWVESENDIEVDMKFGNVTVGKDSVVNIEQNEVSSNVYLLKGTAEVENLAWISTFLSQGKQIKISNKNASNDELDMVALKEDFDDYFKISDWYLKNNGSVALLDTSEEISELPVEDSLDLWTEVSSLWSEVEIKKPLITGNLLSFDGISDEWYVATAATKVTWSFTNELIKWIEIQGNKAVINNENKTFSVASIDTSKQANDVIIKVFDESGSVIAKYLYTLYYSAWNNQKAQNQWFAKINTTAYPVNAEDFIISMPTVKNGETFLAENTMYWTVKNPDVASVLVNGFKLTTFNGKTFRYHAYKRFKTLWEWVNNYEIKYLWKDWKVILKKYITINKKTATAPKAAALN